MAKIIKFPNAGGLVDPAPPVAAIAAKPKARTPVWKRVVNGLIRCAWTVLVLFWPIIKWVVSLDVVYQVGRTMYYWDTPGVGAGWTLLLHFAVLTALTYLVAFYEPKRL
jgi:hypothetical protein